MKLLKKSEARSVNEKSLISNLGAMEFAICNRWKSTICRLFLLNYRLVVHSVGVQSFSFTGLDVTSMRVLSLEGCFVPYFLNNGSIRCCEKVLVT